MHVPTIVEPSTLHRWQSEINDVMPSYLQLNEALSSCVPGTFDGTQCIQVVIPSLTASPLYDPMNLLSIILHSFRTACFQSANVVVLNHNLPPLDVVAETYHALAFLRVSRRCYVLYVGKHIVSSTGLPFS